MAIDLLENTHKDLLAGSLTEADAIRLMRLRNKEAYRKSDEYKKHMGKPTATQAFTIGAGKLANDFIQGAQYLFNDDDEREAQSKAYSDDMQAYNYLKSQRPTATASGEILPYFGLPIGSFSQPASKVLGLLPKMANIAPKLKNSVMLDSIGTGGLLGLFDYNADPITGMIAGGAGSGVSKAVTSFMKPVDNINLTPAQTQNALKGSLLGYKMTPSQRTGNQGLQGLEAAMESNALTSGGLDKVAGHNQANSNRIVAEALGFNGKDYVTPQMLDEVSSKFTDRFNALIKGNSVKLDDQFLNRLAELDEQNTKYWVKNKDASQVIEAALDDVEKGVISAKKYQTLSSKLIKSARSAFKGEQSNPEYGFFLTELKEALDDAAERSLGKTEREAFKSVRSDYRTYAQLMKNRVINEQTGNVSLAQLNNILRREDKRGYRQGQNQSDLYNATRFESSFPRSFGSSGTAERQQLGKLLTGTAVAGGLGLSAGDGDWLTGAGAAALPALGMYGFGKYYNSGLGNKHFTKGLLPVLSPDIKQLIASKGGLLAIAGAGQ